VLLRLPLVVLNRLEVLPNRLLVPLKELLRLLVVLLLLVLLRLLVLPQELLLELLRLLKTLPVLLKELPKLAVCKYKIKTL
jgi:hypothetical protein